MASINPPFQMFERVRIVTADPRHSGVNGLVGTVEWPGRRSERGLWCFGVKVCPDGGDWDCADAATFEFFENELRSIGQFGWQYHRERSHPPRFGLQERVGVSSNRRGLEALTGRHGVVLGRSQSFEGEWAYAVRLDDQELVISLNEEDLASLGAFELSDRRSSDQSVRVRVDEEGRGSLSEPGSG